MNDGELLLRAILLNPAEDTPRLVYADWLDEQPKGGVACYACGGAKTERFCDAAGDMDDRPCSTCAATGILGDHYHDYAEFIRLQIQIPNASAKDVKSGAFDLLLLRANDLLEQHHFTWASGPLVECGWQANSTWVPTFEYQFRRGFVEWVGGPLADFLAHAGAIFAKHPVTSVQTDRFPDGDSGHKNWNWYRAENDAYNGNSASLPASVYELLIGGLTVDSWETSYLTDKDAYADLTQALVTVGRRAAGTLFFPNGTTAPKC